MPDKALLVLDGYFNDNLTISIISKVEILRFNNNADELNRLADFIGLANIVFVDDTIADKTIALRKAYKIKLPDAITAAPFWFTTLLSLPAILPILKTLMALLVLTLTHCNKKPPACYN